MLVAAVAGFAGTAQTQDEGPDLSFLEYLGSWQESDEEWLIAAEMEEELKEVDEASEKDEEANETQDN
jgi:hypothetical protein